MSEQKCEGTINTARLAAERRCTHELSAEPYAVFVEDVLANLTGGVSRIRFRFVPEELTFRLGAHERVLPESLRVTGLADGAFNQFVRERDYRYTDDAAIEWLSSEPAVPAAGAVWPDPGTDVWVGFDRQPGGPAPILNDRNPGSVTRTLAESFAREYAVMSHQLDAIYQAAFVDTAGGRDLDQVAALVGVERRGATHARGEVLFRRNTPATADIAILAGTLVSTTPTAAVAVTVETTDTVTLRRGTVSVAAPVQARQSGPAGVAAANTLTVIHRPIFGIDDSLNPEPMSFGGGAESDEALRARVKRAFETSGRSTVGALKGALGRAGGDPRAGRAGRGGPPRLPRRRARHGGGRDRPRPPPSSPAGRWRSTAPPGCASSTTCRRRRRSSPRWPRTPGAAATVRCPGSS